VLRNSKRDGDILRKKQKLIKNQFLPKCRGVLSVEIGSDIFRYDVINILKISGVII